MVSLFFQSVIIINFFLKTKQYAAFLIKMSTVLNDTLLKEQLLSKYTINWYNTVFLKITNIKDRMSFCFSSKTKQFWFSLETSYLGPLYNFSCERERDSNSLILSNTAHTVNPHWVPHDFGSLLDECYSISAQFLVADLSVWYCIKLGRALKEFTLHHHYDCRYPSVLVDCKFY